MELCSARRHLLAWSWIVAAVATACGGATDERAMCRSFPPIETVHSASGAKTAAMGCTGAGAYRTGDAASFRSSIEGAWIVCAADIGGYVPEPDEVGIELTKQGSIRRLYSADGAALVRHHGGDCEGTYTIADRPDRDHAFAIDIAWDDSHHSRFVANMVDTPATAGEPPKPRILLHDPTRRIMGSTTFAAMP